jgi:hypothetical protein
LCGFDTRSAQQGVGVQAALHKRLLQRQEEPAGKAVARSGHTLHEIDFLLRWENFCGACEDGKVWAKPRALSATVKRVADADMVAASPET